MIEEKSAFNTKELKLKLLSVLIALIILNIGLLMLGPGLGGNYMKSMDSMLWVAPIGCVMWGFFWALLVALVPYKELPYRKKYLPASLFVSILFNVFMLLAALAIVFE